jgi:hypothetical protein
VILGYTFWQNHMGSDPDIVRKTLTLDGIPHVVVASHRISFQVISVFREGHSLFRSNGT